MSAPPAGGTHTIIAATSSRSNPEGRLAAHAAVQEAMDAGVWVFGGGLAEGVDPVMVAGDGTITAGTYPQTKEFNGGFTVLDVPSREAALEHIMLLRLAVQEPKHW